MENSIRKNETFETVIEGYASDGSGVCRVNGMTVFVPYSVAGERLRVRIVKVLSTYAYGRIEEILSPSPERREPDCPHYPRCGGCSTRHLSYEEELRYKAGIVQDALQRIAHIDLPVERVCGSERQEGYRNKATFSFANRDGKIVCGFYRDRTHDVIPVEHCGIQAELSSRIASKLTEILNRYGFTAYDEANGSGGIRHLFIRIGHQSGECVVCITSARGFGEKTQKITEELVAAFPSITGIILDIDKEPGNKLLKGRFHVLWGQDFLTDDLCGLQFRISPLSFYQINSPQAEKLYAKAAEYACLNKNTNVLDLYCGIGTISLYLSQFCKRVVGVEIVEQAVENAKQNAELNGITNAEFYCSDASGFRNYTEQIGFAPDCIVVDPPRKGLDAKTITDVCAYSPERIVYVSCNPATLARDLTVFQSLGYRAEKVSVFDMFPKTSHCEVVVSMSRVGSKQ